jgi:hypothetical protein
MIFNRELAKLCRYPVDQYTYDLPHTKAFLLLQAHFSRLPLPCTDYITDLKSVLDQAIRIIQVFIIEFPLTIKINNKIRHYFKKLFFKFICF